MTADMVRFLGESNHGIGSDFEWSKKVRYLTVILSSPQQRCILPKPSSPDGKSPGETCTT
jgi:hypothetical protein